MRRHHGSWGWVMEVERFVGWDEFSKVLQLRTLWIDRVLQSHWEWDRIEHIHIRISFNHDSITWTRKSIISYCRPGKRDSEPCVVTTSAEQKFRLCTLKNKGKRVLESTVRTCHCESSKYMSQLFCSEISTLLGWARIRPRNYFQWFKRARLHLKALSSVETGWVNDGGGSAHLSIQRITS